MTFLLVALSCLGFIRLSGAFLSLICDMPLHLLWYLCLDVYVICAGLSSLLRCLFKQCMYIFPPSSLILCSCSRLHICHQDDSICLSLHFLIHFHYISLLTGVCSLFSYNVIIDAFRLKSMTFLFVFHLSFQFLSSSVPPLWSSLGRSKMFDWHHVPYLSLIRFGEFEE